MKTTKTTLKVLSLLFFMSIFNSIIAQEVKLRGKIFQKYQTVEDVLIQIYSGDSLIISSRSNGNGKFKLDLEANKEHRLVFSKDNYLSKTIVVAKLEEDTKVPTFKFDVELEKEREFRYVDTSELDDPVAVLFYNPEKGELDWDRNHTFRIHEDIAELKDLNDEKRRERYRNF